MQPWIARFNPSKPTCTKMPIWITLKGIPDEFLSSSQILAISLDPVLGRHKGSGSNVD